MIEKFAAGVIPQPAADAASRELAAAAVGMVSEYAGQMQNFAFSQALQTVWKIISQANKYIVANAPWELAKDPAAAGKLATVLYDLAETLRLIALVLQPIIPQTSARMATALGVGELADLDRLGQWGLLPPGTKIQPGPPLFPRLDKTELEAGGEETKKVEKAGKAKAKIMDATTAAVEELISFDEFKKVDLRVAEIIAAEKIAKSDRLLKLTVKAPDERTIVAGIAGHYQPEDVIGRQVLIVANLKPVKLMGVTSQGMVMAVKDDDRLVLTTVSETMKPGSKVS